MGTKRTVDYELSARELNWNNKGKRQLKPKASVLFHLYTDMDDDFEKSNGTIYLEMRDVYFCAATTTRQSVFPPTYGIASSPSGRSGSARATTLTFPSSNQASPASETGPSRCRRILIVAVRLCRRSKENVPA